MHASTIFMTLLSASGALAAPAVGAVSAMAAVPQWTIKSYTRTCDKSDLSCAVKFSVDTKIAGAPVTACNFTLKKTGATPASQAPIDNVTCGPFKVGSGWSGQFGPGNGFTTLSVVDFSKKLIVWPSYSDAEIVNGKAVSPDKSYAPANL
ncbi:hypothetical protein QBC37DRAFT_296438 [Rhypophila decipiens]|uniref:Uncharacterized protein n=1 Tax=Rhypophila decipiens TaxID=261697 RepID=A0AAN6XXM4_9PEZI|nr:hypothetical protein QBC37DRAFT_296438 [Rhypophila decipiens]